MLKKLTHLTAQSLILLYCGQTSAATVSTAYSDFTKRVNDGLSIDSQGNIYASNVGSPLNPEYTEFSGTALIKIKPDGSSSILSDELAGPLGNVVDKLGNVYVSNVNDKTIKKVTPNGVTTTFAQLDVHPSGITIDKDNNLYVASYVSNNITKVSPDGQVSLYSDDEKLNGPVGITFNDEGQLYIANYNNGDIFSMADDGTATFLAKVEGQDYAAIGYMTYASGNLYATSIGIHQLFKITMQGEVSLLAGTGEGGVVDGPAEEALTHCPNGITADPAGDMLYWNEFCAPGENNNGVIRSLRLQAEVTTHANEFEKVANDGVSVAPDGSVYISNVGRTLNPEFSEFDGTSIIKVTPDGVSSLLTDQLTGPLGNALDSNGNVIVANVNDKTIRSVAPDGTVTTIAQLDAIPAGIAVDPADNIYVASYVSNKIYRVTSSGAVSLYSDDQELHGPVGIVFDEDGQLYVANYNDGKIFSISESGITSLITQIEGPDYFTLGYLTYTSGYLYASGIGNHEVYRISKTGDVTVIAGTTEAGVVDGEGDEAQFNCPNGIGALMDSNELYITDYCAPNQLRKVTVATASNQFYSNNMAVSDEVEVEFNTATSLPVLDNDETSELAADELDVRLFNKPNYGMAEANSDGTITYIPLSGYTGLDNFSYSFIGQDGKRTKPVKVLVTIKEEVVTTEPEAEITTPNKKDSGGGTIPLSLTGVLTMLLFLRRKKS